MNEWRDLGINEYYASRLNAMGYNSATPIQEQAIPKILEGESLLGLARTGTGKTLAYLLPLMNKHFPEGKSNPDKQVLILVPTRELATQVAQSIDEFHLKNSVIVGGEKEAGQLRSVPDASFLVCTPGRLLDLKQRNKLSFKNLAAVIFDEGDRLMDMGFEMDIRKLFAHEQLDKKQVLLFSATMHNGVEILLHEFGVQFSRVQVSADQLTVENLDQKIAYIGEDEKFHALCSLLHSHKDAKQVVIFSNYKDKAFKLSNRLKGLGAAVMCLTSQFSQSGRKNILSSFKSGKIQYLIASDLAARGLDVDHLDLVVNYDLPEDPAVYVHRVGRTARAGKKGLAVSFAGFEDSFRVEKLKKYLKQEIEILHFEDQELRGNLKRFSEAVPKPTENRPSHSQRGRNENYRSQKTASTTAKRNYPVRAQAPTKKKSTWSKLWKKFLSFFISVPDEKTTESEASRPPHRRRRRRNYSSNYSHSKSKQGGHKRRSSHSHHKRKGKASPHRKSKNSQSS